MKTNRLVNIYTPTEVRIWYMLVTEGARDLRPILIEDSAEIGGHPEWYDSDCCFSSIAEIRSYESSIIEVYGHKFRYPWFEWGLENGIAPMQPFQVSIQEPHSYRCSYEYDEWDSEQCWCISDIAPMTRRATVKRFDWFARYLERKRLHGIYLYKREEEEMCRSFNRMYLNRHRYCVRDNDYSPPIGISLQVQASRTGYVPILGRYVRSQWGSGRDDNGNEKSAMEQLIESACRENKYLCPEIIRALPVKN